MKATTTVGICRDQRRVKLTIGEFPESIQLSMSMNDALGLARDIIRMVVILEHDDAAEHMPKPQPDLEPTKPETQP